MQFICIMKIEDSIFISSLASLQTCQLSSLMVDTGSKIHSRLTFPRKHLWKNCLPSDLSLILQNFNAGYARKCSLCKGFLIVTWNVIVTLSGTFALFVARDSTTPLTWKDIPEPILVRKHLWKFTISINNFLKKKSENH